MYDVAIIGAGISGCLIAHRLSKYNLKVAVFEKDNDVAEGASGANSAIIHSGHDPLDNTLKARFNVEGNRMYEALCNEIGAAFKRIGALVVAVSEKEAEALDILYNRARSRDIECEMLDGKKAHEIEPNLSDDVIKALSLPTTGIVTPWEVCINAMEEAILNGVDLYLETAINNLIYDGIYHLNDIYEAKVIIDAAGVYADDIYNLLGECRYHINPRKGEYFILDHSSDKLVTKIIYPLPSEKGKGVLVVPTVHENILLGPNSDFTEKKDDLGTSEALEYVRNNVRKTVKNIDFSKVIHTYAGLRPSGDLHDFVIEEDEKYKGFIHVACIESPGLASAPAIARYVVNELVLPKFNTEVKSEYKHRKKHINMNELTLDEKNQIIHEDGDYGKIICRCEKISLGEIKDVIHRPLGAKTIKAIKRRVRPGMGACQGGFCEPLVFNILKKELNLDEKAITYDGEGSNIVTSKAKELL